MTDADEGGTPVVIFAPPGGPAHDDQTLATLIADIRAAAPATSEWSARDDALRMAAQHADLRGRAHALVGTSGNLPVLWAPDLAATAGFWRAIAEQASTPFQTVLLAVPPDRIVGTASGQAGTGQLDWLRAMLDAERATRGFDRRVAGLDPDGRPDLRAVFTAFGRSDPPLLPVWPAASGREEPLPWVAAVSDTLARWQHDEETLSDHARLDEIRAALDAAAPALALLASDVLDSRLDEARHALTLAEAERREQARRISELSDRLSTAERAADQRAGEIEALRGQLDALGADTSQHEMRIAQMKLALEKAEADLDGAAEARAEAETELRNVSLRLSQTESALQQRRHEADQMTIERNAAREEAATLQARMARNDDETRGLVSDMNRLRASLGDAETRLAASERRANVNRRARNTALRALEARQAATERELSRRQSALDELTEHLRKTESAGAEARVRASRYEARMAEIRHAARDPGGLAEQLQRLIAGFLARAGRGGLTRRGALRRQAAALRSIGILDEAWYAASDPAIERSGLTPAEHFVLYGQAEGRAPNPRIQTLLDTPGMDDEPT